MSLSSVFVSLIVILVYGTYTLLAHVIFSRKSLRDQESIHRFILISSGILVGTGISSQIYIRGSTSDAIVKFSDESTKIVTNSLLLGLMLIMLGMITGVIGIGYLRTVLWKPLEEITEYSAQFGTEFIATRLPLSGGKELMKFSERFNNNILTLANKIANIEIRADILRKDTNQAINSSGNLSGNISRISENVDNYSQLVGRQEMMLAKIDDEISNFISWYDDTQIRLENQFTEIRSLSETGNILSVNASIESVNLETENPGIETIASKLHDLAASLDSRQEDLRSLLIEIQNVYNSFSYNVRTELEDIRSIADNATAITSNIENSLNQLKISDTEINNSSQNLVGTLNQFMDSLPNSY